MRGYVYLIGSSTFSWYKIGKAKRPSVRVENLGILLPFKITVFAIWESEDYSGLEASLHKQYVDYAINGEWFHFEPIKISEILLKTDAKLIYPSQDQNGVFAAFSNIPDDVFKLDSEKYTKRGRPQFSRTVQLQYRLRDKLLKEARDEYLATNNLPATPENKRLAREAVLRLFKS